MTYALLTPSVSLAAGFHKYSYAEENSGCCFTGVRVNRIDANVGGLANNGCSVPYTGDVLYQTQWVLANANDDWRELGTGHSCSDTNRYWYWGFGLNGTWTSLGTESGAPCCTSHSFKISRAFDGSVNRYYFQIDGVTKGSLASERTFGKTQAGIESYSSSADLLVSNSGLQYQTNNGSFGSWSGQDYQFVNIGGEMCGSWAGATVWNAGEGSFC